MNDEPKHKHTASLRTRMSEGNIESGESLRTCMPAANIESTELKKLLVQVTPTPAKRKYEDVPSTSWYSTLPITVDAATQCEIEMVDKSTNYKVRKLACTDPTVEMKSLLETTSTSNPSMFGYTSETEESRTCEPQTKMQGRKIMLDIIFNKPQMYLGLTKQYLWLIDYLVEKSIIKVDSLSLVVTLLKIKQNDTIERISDQLEISKTKLSTMILTGIEALANFFQNFIFCPESCQIKRNLPLVFKIRYSNVQMIIDCFEIEISKPSNPLKQAQTWSQYKNCNTVKYLIGCTPNGFVSFISKGYGGRISDKAIVEKSNLVEILKPNAVVLADRGFKEIESQLSVHGIKLLRPPSVYTGTKQTATEALESKVIASLRVHIERKSLGVLENLQC